MTAAAATQTLTPAAVTRAMRALFPRPINIRTKITDEGTIVITGPLTMRDVAAAQVDILNGLTDGRTWIRVDFTEVGRGTAAARATFVGAASSIGEFETVGRPADWAAEQADVQTVLARHRMVRDLGLATGHNARPGQTVKHIELGIVGRFDRVEGSSAYVTFAGDVDPALVHAADVVVIDAALSGPAVDAARAELAAAEADFAAADNAWGIACRAARGADPRDNQLGNGLALAMQSANVRRRRAELAVAIATGQVAPGTVRFEITSCSPDDGQTWEVIGWNHHEARPGETATAQALRIAVYGRLAESDSLMSPKPWRVQVWTDPMGDRPDGEWTNLTDPCPPGEHGPVRWAISSSFNRGDGSYVRHARCAYCMRGIKRLVPYRLDDHNPNQWVLDGEQLPDPNPAVLYILVEQITDEHHGMEINDGLGNWHTLTTVAPVDAETNTRQVTVEGRPAAKICASLKVQLRQAPIRHDGVAINEHGVPLVSLAGALHYDDHADETGDGTPVGAWHVAGVGDNFDLPAADVDAAKWWAETALAAAGYGTVVGWVAHRDRYSDLWLPTFAGGGEPSGPVPLVPDAAGTGTQDPAAPAANRADTVPVPVPVPQQGGVPIGYRIESRTQDGSWFTARIGWSPPGYPRNGTIGDAVARTVLSNADPALGRSPQDPLAAVRVRTWHRGTGVAGFAERDGVRL